ncbi:26S proteasome non-ATPase regulatory subunit 6 [Exaiptasia diaphana]|uniref:26S proteasome non-ATPase regulatory subunit 6 n=1 Tax=Exaiptasia diaphana TaxID=2652724 RepID=A0A913XM97_EXADI|nr:26S proteasome non-ATPase regulatory subunit 6 [Exaiptasia diaphana]KXJ20234.1 26S proteasome non-ATPase regulatory subunit 6 [Exaiptasia diaphana]
MPVENLEEEGLPNNPNLEISQWKFIICNPDGVNKEQAKKNIMVAVKEKDMAPLYEELCHELKWPVDQALLDKMKKANEEKLKELEKKLKYAEENLGETEIRDALFAQGEYLCSIGNKEGAITAFRKCYDKAVALGYKLDIIFYRIRIGLFYLDNDMMTKNIAKAQELIEEGGDWDRRNRLKVYHGIYYLSIRDFKSAANNFLESISTFTSYELMDYKQFVTLTVLASIISLERVDLKKKVVNGAEILEVLHQLPVIKKFLLSFYNCHYDDFFKALAEVEQILKQDRLMSPHYRHYVREMRILAYTQLLESYRSLTLEYMANAFGVSEAFIDRELSRFIAAGRLHCKIDKVGGIVETNRPDHKNWQYQASIKQGDLLLNRIQKLSRVINI